jgi:hypothetical protein
MSDNMLTGLEGEAAKIGSGIVFSGGKDVVKKAMEGVMDKAGHVESKLSEHFDIVGQEIIIKCPERIQEYSLALTPKESSFLHLNSVVNFDYGRVNKATVTQLRGYVPMSQAVVIKDSGFAIDFKQLRKGETYLVDVEYGIEYDNFTEALVTLESAEETPNEDNQQYWMLAQLKQLDALKGKYGRIDLRDLDFSVNVGIAQDIKTALPSQFRNGLELLNSAVKKSGRGETWNVARDFTSLQQEKYGPETLKLIRELVKVFEPETFKDYVRLGNNEFRYWGCRKGASIYDIPFVSWPRTMVVTSRTSLGFDKPTAKGTLIYEKKGFTKRISSIFDSKSQS